VTSGSPTKTDRQVCENVLMLKHPETYSPRSNSNHPKTLGFVPHPNLRATMEQGAAFTDAAGSTLAITKALFQDANGDLGLLSSTKTINLLAMTLMEPDEVWWAWVQDADNGRWRLKRRYLRAFEIDGSKQLSFLAFEWSQLGWVGSSTSIAANQSAQSIDDAFDALRNGRLVFKK